MLSRVADNLYWMSRYLERAEHTARMVQLDLNLMLDQSQDTAIHRWVRVLESLNMPMPGCDLANPMAMTEFVTFEPANPSSIISCIASARENARNVRELISSEMWEQINRLFLQVRSLSTVGGWNTQPDELFQAVKEGAHLFRGITDSTMTHGEGWHFIILGEYLERAGAIARLLGVHYQQYPDPAHLSVESLDYLEWVRILKTCTGFEAYCKVYKAELRPDRIADFLLFNPEFPHSVRFSVERVQGAIEAVGALTGPRQGAPLERLAGRLRSALVFTPVDEVMGGGLHPYLADIRRQCNQIHGAVHAIYVDYSIEAALAS
jgi:uncharacterized alpha-E superfamily protein